MSFRVGEEPETESQGGGVQSPALPPITLTLPAPPSVNSMFKNVKGVGRVRSRHYDEWRREAGWRLRLQKPGGIKGHVTVSISVEYPADGPRRTDIDNRVKALVDLLVEHKVIEDDSLVVGFCAAWAPPANRLARVLIAPAASHDLRFVLASDGAHGGFFPTTPNEDTDADFPEFPADLDR